jgi:hypothetical protein
MADTRPQIIGSVVSAYVKEVERRALLERVRARAGAELQKVLAKPPLPVSWVDAAAMEDLADAVAAEAGEEVLSAISFDAMRKSVGPVFGAVGRASVAIFRSTPERVFRSIDSVTSLTCRGFTLTYEAGSPTSGTMRIAAAAPLSAAYWITWEGPLGYVYDLCKVAGTVKREPVSAPSAQARFRVEWSARPE